MSLENLMISQEMVTDYEYRNPESVFSKTLEIDSSSDDVLGHFASLVELGDLVNALQVKSINSESILQEADRIFNLQCGKNEVVNIEGEITVNVVEVDSDRLIAQILKLQEQVEGLGLIEFEETEPLDEETSLVMDKLLKDLSMISRRNPVDYHYEFIEIESDNKKRILAFEKMIDNTREVLLRVLTKSNNHKFCLAYAKLQRIADEACTYNDKTFNVTDQVMTVKQVNGDFNLLVDNLVGLVASVDSWYNEHYGDKQVNEENPAPEPLSDRPPMVAYYNSDSRIKYPMDRACNFPHYGFDREWGLYSGHFWHEFECWARYKKYPCNAVATFFAPTGDSGNITYYQKYNWRWQDDVVAHVYNARERYKMVNYNFNIFALQFSTGKNAYIETSDRSKDFNPYGLKNQIEYFRDKGEAKITFTGCDFPGVCLVQAHNLKRNLALSDWEKTNGTKKFTGLILNVTDIELIDGNAVVTVRGLNTGTFTKDITSLHIAYLGSHHCISDAFPDAKVTLYSSAFEEPFIDANYPLEKGILSEQEKDFKLIFQDVPDTGKGYTFLQAHANPDDIDQPISVGIDEVMPNGINYRLSDIKKWKRFKKKLPISAIGFQIDD